MRPLSLLSLVFLVACASTALAIPEEPVSFEGHQVLRFDLSSSSSKLLMAWIEAHRLDVWAHHPEWVDVMMTKAFRHRADELGIPYRVMISDLQADIRAERVAIESVRGLEEASFFDAYRTYDEFNTFIDQLVSTYPQLATKLKIGQTVEGRTIFGILITAPNNASKVGIVFNGGQHAREWIGPMTNAYIANQLLTLYGTDAQVTKLLERVEFSIFPIINADGYVYSWTTNRMWRKNRRENKDSRFRCYGVDTNRNWDFHWGEGGTSPDTCSDIYRGPKAFSEPEETALASYIKSHPNVNGYIDWHSYSQLWLGPWGWSTSVFPKDLTTQNELAKLGVDTIKSVHGKVYQYGPSGATLYVTSGGSNDYTYGALGVVYSYTVELRDTGRYGFVLPPSEIIPTGEESFAAVRVFADYVVSHTN